MNKKERTDRQLRESLHLKNERGATFVGIRPVVMESKKYNKKYQREEGKKLCREEQE